MTKENPLREQGVAAGIPIHSLPTPPCNHALVRAEAIRLIEMGLPIATIIPAELDHLNDKGKPLFTGKNPSYWRPDGTPQIVSHSRPPSPQLALDQIDTAEQISKPIGLSILPGDACTVIDFDPKDYPGGVDECREDVNRLITAHPELRSTRMESTPSGGVHIYLRVADWADFTKPDGKRYGQFTTTPGATLRGELLAGTRVSVTAPTHIKTSDRDGAYVLKGEAPYNLIEVPSLSAIGIHPVGGRQKPASTAAKPPSPPSAPPAAADAPALKALIGKAAQSVLDGRKPYGDDRSANLTGFAKEVYGCENWLKANAKPYRGNADALITFAVDVLEIEDKAERVLAFDRAACNWQQGDQKKAERRYKEVSTGSSHSSTLGVAEVKARLRERIGEGIGAADLAALVAELSTASDLGSISVQRLAEAICAEQHQAASIAVEAQQFAAETDRQDIGKALTASFLLPPTIANALEVRTRYLPTDGPSAVLPYLAAVAGLVKLGTEVEASAAAGYRVPVNLFGCLVGPSGAKKSPVGRLLVEAPTRELRAEMAAANRAALDDWRESCKGSKRGEEKPEQPRLKRLTVSEYTGEALAEQLQTQEAAGLGLLINRDELAGLFASFNQYKGGKGSDEQQMLELFDGGGLTSLRISGDRHYSRSQLSIWGSTQPDVLRELVAKGDANGLWARFLFVPLAARVVPLPLDTNATEVAEVAAAAQTLANACRAVYRLPPQTYKLAPEAGQRFQHFEMGRQLAAQKTTIGAQGALYGKSAGKVLRLAGVFHLLEIATQRATSSCTISADTIDRATALVDHLDAWALSLHAEVAAGGVGQLMRTVHRAAAAATGAIRWKELSSSLSNKQRSQLDPAVFAEAAQALAAAGYGEVETGERGAISYRATRALP